MAIVAEITPVADDAVNTERFQQFRVPLSTPQIRKPTLFEAYDYYVGVDPTDKEGEQ